MIAPLLLIAVIPKSVSAFIHTTKSPGTLRDKTIIPFVTVQNGETTDPTELSTSFLPTINNTSTSAFQPSRSTFPRSAYYLSRDEDNLRHNFISFIDHTLGSSYSQVARLVEPRGYARPHQFEKDMLHIPPTIDDIAPPPSLYGPLATFLAWNRLPARGVVGAMAYLSFPLLIEFLNNVTKNIGSDGLATLLGTFLPGVSIVLGTYFSLTLSILYDRFSRMHETITLEASLLALTFGNVMDLFQNDTEAAIEGAQCIADQIAILVRESRGRETMRVIYGDPYARILQLLSKKRPGADPDLMAEIRSNVGELIRVRSRRISDEALALAPTHFDVMTFLSGLLLIGFALGTVATAEVDGVPSGIARVLFSALMVCYVLLYEMSYDLNRPFDGIYQIRRSGAAMHFLQVKNLISNHPLLSRVVDFELDESLVNESDAELDCEAICNRRKAKIWYN